MTLGRRYQKVLPAAVLAATLCFGVTMGVGSAGTASASVTVGTVRQVQSQLNAHGSHLAVDGVDGALTQTAIVAFQLAHGLAPDGIVGPLTGAALNAAGTTISSPGAAASGSVPVGTVRQVQSLLNGHGAHLAVDGIDGPMTNAAIQAFQASHGLVVDGIVGPITWRALIAIPTAGVSGLGGAPPCERDMPGANVPGIRPALVFIGCATSADHLERIAWTSWTATGATGSATHAINDCQPSCAGGTFTGFPVSVQLSNLGFLNGMLVFRTISMTPTGSTGRLEIVTADRLYGSWGWVPQ